MALPFIFNAEEGQTPESVARQRLVADALLKASQGGAAPQSVMAAIGQGLGDLGDVLAYKRIGGRADAAEKAGRATVPGLEGLFGTNSASPDAVAPPTASNGVDPAMVAGGKTPSIAPVSLNFSGSGSVKRNNPGNIVSGSFASSMPGYIGASGKLGYAEFDSMASGVAAMNALLDKYARTGRDTVRKIINSWSPASGTGNSEASTDNYINFVASKVGVSPDTPLGPEHRKALMTGMAQFEAGHPVNLFGADAAMAAPAAAAPIAAPSPVANVAASLAAAAPNVATPDAASPQVASLDPAAGIATSAPSPDAAAPAAMPPVIPADGAGATGLPPDAAPAPAPVAAGPSPGVVKVAQSIAASPDAGNLALALKIEQNPWATPAQKAVAQAIIESRLKQSDPAYQLSVQKDQAQLDQLKQGGPPPAGYRWNNGSLEAIPGGPATKTNDEWSTASPDDLAKANLPPGTPMQKNNITGELKPLGGSGSSGGIGAEGVSNIVDGVISGKIPLAALNGMYRNKAAIVAGLADKGFDISGAMIAFNADQRFYSQMNSGVQVRIRQNLDTLGQSIPLLRKDAEEWNAGGFPLLNKVNLVAATQGVYGPKANAIAAKLIQQIADVTGAAAGVIMGGGTPTDAAFKIAGDQISQDWSYPTLMAAADQLEQNLNFRKQAIAAEKPIVPGENIYAPDASAAPAPAPDASGTSAPSGPIKFDLTAPAPPTDFLYGQDISPELRAKAWEIFRKAKQ